jgi:hypothetical protein
MLLVLLILEWCDMKKAVFDPFSSRLSRKIRNSLSSGFVRAVHEMEPVYFTNVAGELLGADIESAQKGYVKDRLARYEECFSEIRIRGLVRPLSQAAVAWRRGLYFEVHELLESEWKLASGETREALGGMIKAAGAYIQRERGNTEAAASLARKAAAILRKHKEELSSFEGLDDIIEALEKEHV